jgi:hypothetical protein
MGMGRIKMKIVAFIVLPHTVDPMWGASAHTCGPYVGLCEHFLRELYTKLFYQTDLQNSFNFKLKP